MAWLRWRYGWDPFRELKDLQERMNRVIAEGYGLPEARVEETGTFPPLNMYRGPDAYTVVAEVPGIALEHIDLTVMGDTLTIKGDRKAPEIAEERYHRQERRFGYFNRLISIPERVGPEGISAVLKDGLLIVTLPKAAEAKPKKISVSTS
jgi:HSP20 family protein